MTRRLLSFLAMAAFCAPAFADEACGTADAPKSCVSLTSGGVTVIARDERREYVAAGLEYSSPVLSGFQGYVAGTMFAVQDGAAASLGAQHSFRVVQVDAGLQRKVAGPLALNAHGGMTLSIEGEKGAPLDPRQWDALLDLKLLVGDSGYVAVRGGHDGAIDGWGTGIDVNIPVSGAPSIVARYQLPFVRDPRGTLPWVITAGVRVRVKSIRLGK